MRPVSCLWLSSQKAECPVAGSAAGGWCLTDWSGHRKYLMWLGSCWLSWSLSGMWMEQSPSTVAHRILVDLEAEASLWPPKEEGGVLKVNLLSYNRGKLRPGRAKSPTLVLPTLF